MGCGLVVELAVRQKAAINRRKWSVGLAAALSGPAGGRVPVQLVGSVHSCRHHQLLITLGVVLLRRHNSPPRLT